MTLGHDRLGSGPPLVLIHGLGADRHVWRPVIDRLAAERDVIAVDMPGFGDTPALNHGSTPSPPALALAVAEGLDELGLPCPHVAELAQRGLEPFNRETYANGVSKAIYRDADGNEVSFGGGPG